MEIVKQTGGNDELMQLISFNMGNKEAIENGAETDITYGVDIMKTLEIIRVPEITRPPLCPDIIEGMINLRGKVIPILNLRKRFGLRDMEKTTDTKIVIMKVMAGVSETVLGLVVDFTPEIYRIPTSQIEPPQLVMSGGEDDCVRFIGKMNDKLIQILDIDKIIPEQMRNAIVAAAAAAIKSKAEEVDTTMADANNIH